MTIPVSTTAVCVRHGMTDFYYDPDREGYRCIKCLHERTPGCKRCGKVLVGRLCPACSMTCPDHPGTPNGGTGCGLCAGESRGLREGGKKVLTWVYIFAIFGIPIATVWKIYHYTCVGLDWLRNWQG